MLKRTHVLITLVVLGLQFNACKNSQLNISDSTHTVFAIDSTLSSNIEFENYIKPYQLQLDSQMNKVIGRSNETLMAKKPESPLSNFVVDIMQKEALAFISETNKKPLPLISLINTKGLRADIPKGKVMVRDIYGVMPFENQIVLLELTGENILSLVDHIVASGGDGIAGLSFEILSGKAQNIKIDGKVIDPKSHYYLSTSDYIANGGDNYSMLKDHVNRYNVNQKVREAIIAHIEYLTKEDIIIEAKTNKRITLL